MVELPAPFTDASHDVSGLDGFMLNTDKLMASELWALASGDEFKAAVGLWCRAWKQVPAGSLPNDEKVLAAFSGSGKAWPKVREVALRGFILCSDGRFYHKTLCEDVHRAALAKAQRRDRTKAATEARNAKRDGQRNETRNDKRDVDQDGNVTKSHRQDRTGQEDKEGTLSSSQESTTQAREAPPKPSSVSRGTRLPQDFKPLPNVLIDATNRGLTEAEIADQLERFRDWANAATGQVSIKRDWQGACRNWLRRAADVKKEKAQRYGTNQHRQNAPSIASGFAKIDAAFAAEEAAIREEERRQGIGETDADELPGLR